MKYQTLIITLLFAVNTYAETTYNSSLLEIKEGFVGQALGVEVATINYGSELITVQLDLPNLPGELNNLQILDSHNNLFPVRKAYEVIRDHDNTPKGLILYLDRAQKRPFKITYDVTDSD